MTTRSANRLQQQEALVELLQKHANGLTQDEIEKYLGIETNGIARFLINLEERNIRLWEDKYGRIGIFDRQVIKQNEKLADMKWKGDEPYLVSLIDVSSEYYRWLLEDIERLKQIDPNQFQQLVADRLSHLGLEIQLVGDINRKDGGIDIIAYPHKSNAFLFLIGVQVKHHRTERKTGAPDIRDLYGVLSSRNSPFHCGMIVTNTSFTADAKWFAAHNQTLLRLRDLSDLRRWLNNDYANENEWREIPRQIEVAPGIKIEIPRPRIIVSG
jgi:hypothetical protein